MCVRSRETAHRKIREQFTRGYIRTASADQAVHMPKQLKAGERGVNPAVSAKNMVKHLPPKFNIERPLRVKMLVKDKRGKSAVALRGPYSGG